MAVNKIKSKKAEGLTAEQIVSIVIVVITFGILLIFYMVSNWTTGIDKETCHQSVVFRATSNGLIETSRMVPLKCQTERICFSKGSNCAMLGVDTKDNKVTRIKLSSDNKKTREEIKEAIANALYDCNSMLGEGKLNYMPRDWESQNYCLICSRFALDDNTLAAVKKGEIEDISFGEMYQYLQNKKTSDGKSYLEYLHPGWTDWRRIVPVFEEYKSQAKYDEIKNMKFEDWKINLGSENGYVIISQMKKPGTIWSWVYGGVGATVVGGLLTLTGIGAPTGIVIIAASAASGGAITWYSHPGGQYDYTPPEVYPYQIKDLNNIGCSSFETAP